MTQRNLVERREPSESIEAGESTYDALSPPAGHRDARRVAAKPAGHHGATRVPEGYWQWPAGAASMGCVDWIVGWAAGAHAVGGRA